MCHVRFTIDYWCRGLATAENHKKPWAGTGSDEARPRPCRGRAEALGGRTLVWLHRVINPADLAPQIAPAAAHESLGEQPSMANRVAALVWMLRTALQHTQFGALPTTLVSDTSPESAAAWQRAKSAALAGMDHDGQDPRSVAWTTALHKAVNRW